MFHCTRQIQFHLKPVKYFFSCYYIFLVTKCIGNKNVTSLFDGICLLAGAVKRAKMSYMLQHLHNGWQVDQAILSEEDRVIIIRFGHDWDPTCMVMDETLYKSAEKMKNFAVIFLVDISQVPEFNKMYELYDPCTCMFFYRNKHIMIDLGTGNNNKINWAMEDEQEFIDIVETVYRGARKGRGLVISPKDYSTKYRY